MLIGSRSPIRENRCRISDKLLVLSLPSSQVKIKLTMTNNQLVIDSIKTNYKFNQCSFVSFHHIEQRVKYRHTLELSIRYLYSFDTTKYNIFDIWWADNSYNTFIKPRFY